MAETRQPSPRAVVTLVCVIGGLGIVAMVATTVLLAPRDDAAAPAPTRSERPSPTPRDTPTPTPIPTPTFDAAAMSIDDPASLWVVVDKLRPLSVPDYEPSDLVLVPVAYANEPYLRQVASDAVVAMFEAFTAESGGLEMQSQSAHRSYASQERVYAGWVSSLGQAGADLTSARPGHSEHQTGLAIDVSALPANCSLERCFADTPQGQWLAANSWRFGFIVRYPLDATPITGFEYEPWHMRYVGIELATEMHVTGVTTMEEFFGLPPAPDYAG